MLKFFICPWLLIGQSKKTGRIRGLEGQSEIGSPFFGGATICQKGSGNQGPASLKVVHGQLRVHEGEHVSLLGVPFKGLEFFGIIESLVEIPSVLLHLIQIGSFFLQYLDDATGRL